MYYSYDNVDFLHAAVNVLTIHTYLFAAGTLYNITMRTNVKRLSQSINICINFAILTKFCNFFLFLSAKLPDEVRLYADSSGRGWSPPDRGLCATRYYGTATVRGITRNGACRWKNREIDEDTQVRVTWLRSIVTIQGQKKKEIHRTGSEVDVHESNVEVSDFFINDESV